MIEEVKITQKNLYFVDPSEGRDAFFFLLAGIVSYSSATAGAKRGSDIVCDLSSLRKLKHVPGACKVGLLE